MLNLKIIALFGILWLGLNPFENSTSKWSLLAENNYGRIPKIKEIKGVSQRNQMPGKEIYDDFCIQCHGANGKGDGKNFPPLDGSDWLSKKRSQSIHAVKFGQSGQISVNKIKYNNNMPAMGLSNVEVADVMNYIMNSWSNKQMKKVSVEEVEKIIN